MDWPTVSNFLAQHADKIPFMALAVNGEDRPKFSGVRIVEALLIAAFSAGMTMYGTVQVLSTKIDNLAVSVNSIQVHEQNSDDRLYELERDLSRLQGKMDGIKP